MFDIKLIRGDNQLTLVLPVNSVNYTINRDISHGGIVRRSKNNNITHYQQDAILVDNGSAHELYKISGTTWLISRQYNFEGNTYIIPGIRELEDAIYDWWSYQKVRTSTSGCTILEIDPNNKFYGMFGNCKLKVSSKNPDALDFSIEFKVFKKVI